MYMYVYNFKYHYLLMKIQVREFFVFDVVFAHNYHASFENVFFKHFVFRRRTMLGGSIHHFRESL